MAKVSASISLTLKLTKNNDFQMIKPSIEIMEIDTEGNVEQQLVQAVEALDKLWIVETEQVNEKIMTKMPVVNADIELLVSTKLAEFKEIVDKMAKEISILQENEKIGSITPDIGKKKLK